MFHILSVLQSCQHFQRSSSPKAAKVTTTIGLMTDTCRACRLTQVAVT